MANPEINYHYGAPIVDAVWGPVSSILDAGLIQSATETRVVYADGEGNRVVLLGSFDLSGGLVVGGIVTGFDAYQGAAKLMTAKGYSISATTLVDAIADAENDQGEAFWNLVWYRPLDQVGSDQDDEMYGTGFAGSLSGGAGNDMLWGSTGNEVLKGGKGNDLLYGSFGFDRLIGGGGKDLFVISDVLDDDRIMDFAIKDDVVALVYGLVEELGVGQVGKSEFHIGSAAKSANQHLIYNDATGALYYDADGSDVAAQVQIAELDKHLDLQARHFFVSSDYEIK